MKLPLKLLQINQHPNGAELFEHVQFCANYGLCRLARTFFASGNDVAHHQIAETTLQLFYAD